MLEFSSTSNLKAIGKEWHGRGHPQYEPEIHLPMVEEIFSNGGGVYAFLYACKISKVTFYTWIKRYPEFKNQYEISLYGGAAIWELLPLEWAKNGIPVNNTYWCNVMRQRYKYGVPELQKSKSDTTSSRMKATWRSLRKGGITPQEFNQIASGLSTESRIAEVDLQKQALDHAKESSNESKEMTNEALRAYILVLKGTHKVVEVENIDIVATSVKGI